MCVRFLKILHCASTVQTLDLITNSCSQICENAALNLIGVTAIFLKNKNTTLNLTGITANFKI